MREATRSEEDPRKPGVSSIFREAFLCCLPEPHATGLRSVGEDLYPLMIGKLPVEGGELITLKLGGAVADLDHLAGLLQSLGPAGSGKAPADGRVLVARHIGASLERLAGVLGLVRR